jgi:hypothetical protein
MCSFGIRFTFQVAKDDWSLVFSWQSSDLLVEHGSQFVPQAIRRRIRGGHFRNLPFLRAPADGDGSGPPCHAISDAIEPISQGRWIADRPGFLQEDEKRRLKSIVGLVGILEEAAANTQHHRAVPFQKRGEGSLVFAADEKVQEVRVGGGIRRPNRSERGNGPDRGSRALTWHLCEYPSF